MNENAMVRNGEKLFRGYIIKTIIITGDMKLSGKDHGIGKTGDQCQGVFEFDNS